MHADRVRRRLHRPPAERAATKSATTATPATTTAAARPARSKTACCARASPRTAPPPLPGDVCTNALRCRSARACSCSTSYSADHGCNDLCGGNDAWFMRVLQPRERLLSPAPLERPRSGACVRCRSARLPQPVRCRPDELRSPGRRGELTRRQHEPRSGTLLIAVGDYGDTGTIQMNATVGVPTEDCSSGECLPVVCGDATAQRHRAVRRRQTPGRRRLLGGLRRRGRLQLLRPADLDLRAARRGRHLRGRGRRSRTVRSTLDGFTPDADVHVSQLLGPDALVPPRRAGGQGAGPQRGQRRTSTTARCGSSTWRAASALPSRTSSGQRRFGNRIRPGDRSLHEPAVPDRAPRGRRSSTTGARSGNFTVELQRREHRLRRRLFRPLGPVRLGGDLRRRRQRRGRRLQPDLHARAGLGLPVGRLPAGRLR